MPEGLFLCPISEFRSRSASRLRVQPRLRSGVVGTSNPLEGYGCDEKATGEHNLTSLQLRQANESMISVY